MNLILAITTLIALTWGVLEYLDKITLHDDENKVQIPQLVGKTIDEIEDELKALEINFLIIDSVFVPGARKGSIVDQEPGATVNVGDSIIKERFVKKGRTIYLTINELIEPLHRFPKWNKVPVRELLTKAKITGFKVDSVINRPYKACDCVIEVLHKGKPIADTARLPYGSLVTVVAGNRNLGASIPTPNFVGLTLQEAKNKIIRNALIIGNISYANLQDTAANVVIKQNPFFGENSIVFKGSKVDLVLGRTSN